MVPPGVPKESVGVFSVGLPLVCFRPRMVAVFVFCASFGGGRGKQLRLRFERDSRPHPRVHLAERGGVYYVGGRLLFRRAQAPAVNYLKGT